MPAEVSRLLHKFISGMWVSDTADGYIEFDRDALVTFHGNARMANMVTGDGTNQTNISATGRQTFAGTARNRVSTWLGPGDFYTLLKAGASPNGLKIQSGSLMVASAPIDLSASISGSLWTACPPVPLIAASVASNASLYGATAFIPKPQNADTSGSIIPKIHWTVIEDLEGANASDTFAMYAAVTYLSGFANDACPVRKAACSEKAASYAVTGGASGQLVTTCLPSLPSWGANDFGAALTVGWNMSNASSEGSGSHVGILGVELEYTSDRFGAVSPE